jgi:group I intron endonuclease
MDKGNIYKITNKINNKIYIGCTIYSLEKRFSEHAYRALKTDNKSKLYSSIRKYGVKSFSIELIQECDLNIIYEIEKKYITELDTYDNGLNSTFGGEGCLGYVHSPEIRKKISEGTKNGNSHKGKTYDELYGDNADEERMKRKLSVKKGWENLTIEEKENRVLKVKTSLQKKSKYGIELVKEIKNKINKGLKVQQLKQLYPQVREGFLYELKNGKCWTNI